MFYHFDVLRHCDLVLLLCRLSLCSILVQSGSHRDPIGPWYAASLDGAVDIVVDGTGGVGSWYSTAWGQPLVLSPEASTQQLLGLVAIDQAVLILILVALVVLVPLLPAQQSFSLCSGKNIFGCFFGILRLFIKIITFFVLQFICEILHTNMFNISKAGFNPKLTYLSCYNSNKASTGFLCWSKFYELSMNSYVIVYSFTRERDDRGSYSVGVPPLLYKVSVLHGLRNHILVLHLMDWPCGVHNRLHLGNCKNWLRLGHMQFQDYIHMTVQKYIKCRMETTYMDTYKHKRYTDTHIKYNEPTFEGMLQEFCVFCCEITKFAHVRFSYGQILQYFHI